MMAKGVDSSPVEVFQLVMMPLFDLFFTYFEPDFRKSKQ